MRCRGTRRWRRRRAMRSREFNKPKLKAGQIYDFVSIARFCPLRLQASAAGGKEPRIRSPATLLCELRECGLNLLPEDAFTASKPSKRRTSKARNTVSAVQKDETLICHLPLTTYFLPPIIPYFLLTKGLELTLHNRSID